MLWYKSWLETRWRFLIGLALAICSAVATVLTYPQVLKLLQAVPPHIAGPLGERVREAVELARNYHSFIWSNWFRKNLAQYGTLFAALLGTSAPFGQGGGTLFTLSLPISRSRVLGIRAATGLIELFAMVLVPSLMVPLLSPAINESYSVADALIHALCLYIAASVFFAVAFLLSTIFNDPWRPLLIALGIALVLSIPDQILRNARFSIFRVMSAEVFFRRGLLPWPGLLAAAAISALLFSSAAAVLARRDY